MKITRVTVRSNRYYYIQDLEARKPNGRPKQKWHPLTHVDDGEPALLEALAELLGTDRNNTDGNMASAIAGYRKVKLPELTPAVAKEYGRMFDAVAKAFAAFNVEQVTPGDVLAFLNDNFADKPTTRRAYKARLSSFFSWCVLNRLTPTNPCRELTLKAPPKRKATIKTPEIFHAIRDALPPIGQCFMDLCFLTTARPTEIRLLRESQIYDGAIHFLPSKTEDSSGATVDWPITPEIAAVLERARSLNKLHAIGRGDAFVIQESSGSCYTKSGLFSMFTRARKVAEEGIEGKRAGVPGCKHVTTRDIRPYALTCAEKAGYALEDLRKAAAHTTTSTTEGYLDQYRSVVSPVRLTLPQRPKL